ncbi:hypothetical protein BST81_25965 [Leptolyngbya sp. 'hensonii']|nr:hypothetical protein BST81_25965 [Leptolyngbya sp. 'hensonii']
MRQLKFLQLAIASFLIANLLVIFTAGAPAKTPSRQAFSLPPQVVELAQRVATTQAAGSKSLDKNAIARSKAGQFTVYYDKVDNPLYRELNQAIRESKAFETIAVELTKLFKLPTDVTIVFGECGTANAFYVPDKKYLVMCGELMEHFANIFASQVQTEEELGLAIVNTTLFVFFHETGHGLVDIFNLPITGREEDAVDEFSTLLLMEAGEEGEQAVLTAAQWFLIESSNKTGQEPPFWDEHSLDMQRFYNIACLAYGKNPSKYTPLVEGGVLPESRASRCEREYKKKYASWNSLLEPYMR